MKKISLCLFLISGLLLMSCQKELETNQESLEALDLDITPLSITNPNDPNLDPNWEFYLPSVTTGLIYYGQRINGEPVKSVETNLPWFTAGNPVNNEDNDYLPELGWELYLKDFGTPERPAQTPFFALYNKYSGVLRFFVYNYRIRNLGEQSKTYYIAELGFNQPSNYNSSLSFFASEDEFVKSKTNPNNKQIVVTKKDVSDTWLNFDFVVTHDLSHSELLLNIYGANETDLSLGTDFSTLTSRSQGGANSTSTSGFSSALEKGYEYISSITSFAKAIENLINKSDASTFAQTEPFYEGYSIPTTENESVSPQVAITTITGILGAIQASVGLVKTFFGGKKSTTATQTTVQYSGIVKTTGTANISNNLYSLQFHQDPSASLTANRYKPIYTGRTGLIGAPDNLYLQAEQFAYTNCNNENLANNIYFYNFNSRFVYDTILGGLYNNPDLNGKVSVSKFEAYLVNNALAEKGYFATNDAPDYNTYRRYNTFKFLEYTPESINNGIGFNTVHTPSKNLLHALGNDEVRIEFGRYSFNRAGLNREYPWFDNEKNNHPKIA